ncbi:MAG: transcription termination factor NusA [Sphaerochaetaceae bacterium]|nr:transcription termination factor NusA [Sphaerochaetaceae bacterium]
MSELSEAIRAMVEEKGISQELVLDTIKQTLLATYRRKYGTDENAVVTFAEDLSSVELAKRVTVVEYDDLEDEVTQISLEEAQELSSEAEVGDELLIPIDPKSFDRISVQTGKQRAQSAIREIQKDELLQEYRGKVGEIINGYVQGDKDGDLIIDLGKTQGYLPRKNQSPKEYYTKGDKIRCYVESVRPDERSDKNIRVLLSRVHEDFVRKLFEIYVPELVAKDPSIEIIKIVREAGYRTKVAVYPKKVEADAVGTCVGLKGNRIQSIMKELDDERIDVIKWDPNPLEFIANALSPAKVLKVYVIDQAKKEAVAIVDDAQLSLAIGKQGLNVRLVNRLCDWVVNVKTQDQFAEMDISREARSVADSIFMDVPEDQMDEQVESMVDEDEMALTDLPLDKNLVEKLNFYDIYSVEEFINLTDEDFANMPNLSASDVDKINEVIRENVDIVEDEVESTEEEGFACPKCGFPLTVGMTECPNCHVGISFEEVEEETEE